MKEKHIEKINREINEIIIPIMNNWSIFNEDDMEKSEYAVTSNELKNQFDIPIQLFLSCIGYQ